MDSTLLQIDTATRELIQTDPGRIYGRAVLAHLPRLLGQIDRNPHSPTYGSCCRNFWHYRIEDISNSQLQEVVLTLALAYHIKADWNPYAGSPQLLRWTEAVLRYWTTLQRSSGSFDEVYRGQDSYAATAFTSYCSSEATLLLRDVLDDELVATVTASLERAAHWLTGSDEQLACNQISGAIAALINTSRLSNNSAHERAARQLLDRLGRLQTSEGWFNEYGGADIGYSSLTLDYLVKIHAATGWDDAGEMAERLLKFLVWFVHRDGTGGGVHGSRNTEYIIPHGIELLAAQQHSLAGNLGNLLLNGIASHPERAVVNRLDDRYLCYLGGFFMQAAASARARPATAIELPCTSPHSQYFPAAGLWSTTNAAYHLVVSTAKGGALRCDFHDGASFQDGGLFVTRSDGQVFTTQALQQNTATAPADDNIDIAAPLLEVKHITISPWRAILFKGYNLTMPRQLRRLVLDLLRKRAVSSGTVLGQSRRNIHAGTASLEIRDRLALPQGSFQVRVALLVERAFSFASSGFFHPAESEQPSALPDELNINGPAGLTIKRTLDANGWHTHDHACTRDDTT
jgi:hypothetical protein